MPDVADFKVDLAQYLQEARDVVLLELEGLGEYDARRPLTPSETNLLGLVKHLALVEVGYFSVPFGRPVGRAHPWFSDDVEDNVDMWATAEESREDVVAGYRRAWAQVDATVAELPLDAVGRIPWWGPDGGAEVTLHRVLVHVIGETHRHAGHPDIVRELVDGSVGNQSVGDNLPDRDEDWWLPDRDEDWWRAHRERLERAAREAAGR